MIAAIPAEDQPTIIRQPVPEHLAQAVRNGTPHTCLSCGAKTDEQGALPCGH